ncbi:hypothetical protein EF912_21160 [Streptomyces sp. WAC07061]|uniref:hypothetical protein n=1 Tax=Streptomyces sp. WAC07061 TaxID=2487410 RepID=UPI000F7761D8|nr:hypothetical protein [Streptomyces sp. WAC07061]RSS51080.1 hypothetical protein EF912_21160 [Streptomyces sp. WAC07061]
MIAGTPVARWDWGRDTDGVDPVMDGLRDLITAYCVLASHRLAAGTPRIHVAVLQWGAPNNRLFEGDLVAPEGLEPAEAAELLARDVRAAMRPGDIGAVQTQVHCSGTLAGRGAGELVHGMFLLGSSAYGDFTSVDLVTFSDVWMPYDLRGRAQEAVCAANRPRLAAALAEIAEALGSETDPDDATWLGIPTESGVENHFEDDDGTPSDVWGRFEIPYRNGIFGQTPKFTAGYGRQASGPVRYVPVVGAREVLGYLWASDAEGAASFEPRDAADLDAYRAGLVWLERLQDAYGRGLAPRAALAELGGSPGDPVAGRPEPGAAVEVAEFGELALLALE